MNKKEISNGGTVDNRTSKIFICTDGCSTGKGKTLNEAYKNYCENGSDMPSECTFYEANEIQVELRVK